jgi:hypothetical protein
MVTRLSKNPWEIPVKYQRQKNNGGSVAFRPCLAVGLALSLAHASQANAKNMQNRLLL